MSDFAGFAWPHKVRKKGEGGDYAPVKNGSFRSSSKNLLALEGLRVERQSVAHVEQRHTPN